MRILVLGALLTALSGVSSHAHALDPYRRPGLGGPIVTRHLTAPRNALQVTLGPGQPQLLGQRFDDVSVDAGFEYDRRQWAGSGAMDEPAEWWFRGGVLFGLTEDWEAGALFIPIRMTPDFHFGGVLVPITRGFRFEHVDFGLRLTLQTPIDKEWELSPSVPVLWRIGSHARLDASVGVPVGIGDGAWAGLNVPVRVTVNATPALFVGLESGVYVPRFDEKSGTTVALGLVLGWTALVRKSVIDLTAAMKWDDMLQLDPAPGVDTFQGEAFRIDFGITYHKLVK